MLPGIVPTSSEVTIASFMQVLGTGSCGTVWLVADEADTPHSVLRPISQSDEAAGEGERGGGRAMADMASMELHAHATLLPSAQRISTKQKNREGLATRSMRTPRLDLESGPGDTQCVQPRDTAVVNNC